MWDELGISAGTAIIVLIALYFVIKWGVKNGIEQFFEESGKGKKIMRYYKDYYEKNEKEEGEEEEI